MGQVNLGLPNLEVLCDTRAEGVLYIHLLLTHFSGGRVKINLFVENLGFFFARNFRV